MIEPDDADDGGDDGAIACATSTRAPQWMRERGPSRCAHR